MDNDMLEDFYVEADELFDEAEESLLSIEKTTDYQSCYNSIFRTFHSIKGASGMFGINRLQEHMHFVENLLEAKKDLKTMSPAMVDYLLSAVDTARTILKDGDAEFDYFDPDEAGDVQKEKIKINQELTRTFKKDTPEAGVNKKNKGVVFLVDDEEEILELLEDMLLQYHFDIHTYTLAEKALEDVPNKKPDLIITDLQMPGMNGIELIHEVNKIRPHLPVIVVSGFATKEFCLNAFTYGVGGVLEKPYDPEKLLRMSQLLINRFQNMKLLSKSIDLLVYQFEAFDAYLLEKFGATRRDVFRLELKEILKQKKELFDNLR